MSKVPPKFVIGAKIVLPATEICGTGNNEKSVIDNIVGRTGNVVHVIGIWLSWRLRVIVKIFGYR